MVELTQQQIVGISIACAVVVLGVGLTVTLLLVKRNEVKERAPDAVVPPTNPGAPIQPVKTLKCAPGDGFNGPVPCDKQSMCDGCIEYTDINSVYSCVPITGGNGAVNSAGQLVHPQTVTFAVPPSKVKKTCSGHGKLDGNTNKCVCENGFSGPSCEMQTIVITTPGNYCLPQATSTCNTPTTDSVLVNDATGKGGKYECQCKPEYDKMYTQSVEGGVCDTALICGGNQVETKADYQTPQLYKVYKGKKDDNGVPLFIDETVVANRVTGAGLTYTEACVAKVAPPQIVNDGADSVPYKQGLVDPMSDPTCIPELYSNYCAAQTTVSADRIVKTIVRGSNRPGDPLQKRVYPNFYPPVPPTLQPCPDGASGKNTLNKPCMDNGVNNDGKDKQVIQFQPTKESWCNKSMEEFDPSDLSQYDTGKWFNSVLTDSGEWNGNFTCLNDLRTARVKMGGVEMPAGSVKWNTVNQNGVVEVSCDDSSSWRVRGDDLSFSSNDNCVGPGCEGVHGIRQKSWDGFVTGPLFNQNGLPWFVTNVQPTARDSIFGGQCSCNGLAFRSDGKNNVVTAPMMPGYMSANTGETNWWSCVPDTCWTPETPNAYLKQDRYANFKHPQCECNDGQQPPSGPYSTHISYKAEGEFPTCIRDPCNPSGYKTRSDITCKATADCQGVCYANKCHYPASSQSCTSDAQCVVLNEGKAVQGTCNLETKKCLYADPERAGTFCETGHHEQCSYGVCSNVQTIGFNQNGQIEPITMGTCSGGCVCAADEAQAVDLTNPLGYTCKKRCDITPCAIGNSKSCTVNEKGERVCDCLGCYTGKNCEITRTGSRIGDYCYGPDKFREMFPGVTPTPDTYGICCEGECDNANTQKCVKL